MKDSVLKWGSTVGTLAFTGYVSYMLLGYNSVTSDVASVSSVYDKKEPVLNVESVAVKKTAYPSWSDAYGFASSFIDFKVHADDTEDIELGENGKLNILLMGVDSRGDDLVGRSDTLMVITLDKESGEMQMLSIPRDSYVTMAGTGRKDKINHAYAYGGVEMAKSTVENMLELKIDHYGVFNFSSFKEIIDTLGGVEVDIPFSFKERNQAGVPNALVFTEGRQLLNGEEALAFARMRKQDPRGDIGRGERQQLVVQAVIRKLTDLSSITKYKSVYEAVDNNTDTDIGLLDIPSFLTYLKDYDVERLTLQGEGVNYGGVYYHQLYDNSLEEIKKALKE